MRRAIVKRAGRFAVAATVAFGPACASTEERVRGLEQRLASLEAAWKARVQNREVEVARAEERERFDEKARPGDPFPRTTPREAGIGMDRIRRVIAEAERTHSDSLMVLHDGRLLVDRTFGRSPGPVGLRSITKSFTGVAIGMLLADGKIASLDVPISTWFPEWSDGLRARVTLRHLLEHTSGIEHEPGDAKLYPQTDTVAYVRSHAVLTEPGSTYSYNNDAVQLLAAIVERAAGEKLDDLLRRRLFEPLGFGAWSWARDATGNPYGYAALKLHRIDLARFGELVLRKGIWHGKPLIPAAWIAESTKPTRASGSHYGFLWEIYRRTDRSTQRRVVAGFGHSGSYGQYLVILPDQKMVVIRQNSGEGDEGSDFRVQEVIDAFATQ